MQPDEAQIDRPATEPVPKRRPVPWVVSFLSLLILLPVGWTAWVALRGTFSDGPVALRALCGVYAVLGLFLVVRRVLGVAQERRLTLRRDT